MSRTFLLEHKTAAVNRPEVRHFSGKMWRDSASARRSVAEFRHRYNQSPYCRIYILIIFFARGRPLGAARTFTGGRASVKAGNFPRAAGGRDFVGKARRILADKKREACLSLLSFFLFLWFCPSFGEGAGSARFAHVGDHQVGSVFCSGFRVERGEAAFAGAAAHAEGVG